MGDCLGKSRGRVEIYRDVLRFCIRGECKSHIIEKCGLSWSQVQEILLFLMKGSFLEASKEKVIDSNGHPRITTIYRTTRKGITLLLAIENIDVILGRSIPYGPFYVATATR